MTDADRLRIHGRLQPMDHQPPAGPSGRKTPRPSRDRTRIAIALACFWSAMAILSLLLMWR
ncbi:hypothetical protein [uncultured Novosphingobium sp.]|uniref:hypothetical protein n=1 Tax=uncultured Novosphingobium sp. TaxID=292277 RepID=UPI002585D528|nr:hypothetical protein [uncultured Novosphingobium sp.]